MHETETETPDEDRYASCADRALLIDWRINRHLFYTFSIDTDDAERILPEPLQIIERLPGLAVMSVGLLRYEPGQFGPDSPVFHELVGAIHVAPDLSVDMPLPNMTFSSFQVLSDSEDFVEQEGHTLYTPCRHVELEVDLTEDELGVSVSDQDGPIMSMPSSHPEPRWTHREMWGQHFTNTKGLQHGIWEWDGHLFEHQRPLKGWKLHPHPFWCGLDVGRVRGLYRTMVLEPGTVCHERFYGMRPVES